jgi:hypothetical protein
MKKFDKVRVWDTIKNPSFERVLIFIDESDEYPFKTIFESDIEDYTKGDAVLFQSHKNAELIEEEFNVDEYLSDDEIEINYNFLNFADKKFNYFESRKEWKRMRHKIKTLLRMEAWAKHYNEVDGFVANWSDENQRNWGVVFGNSNKFKVDCYYVNNIFIFQICVASKERANQMLEKFRTDLEKIFNNK